MRGCDQRGEKKEKEAAAGSHLAPGGREQGQHRLAWGRARTGPGGTLEGKQLLSNLPGARDSSKEAPHGSTVLPEMPRAAQVAFARTLDQQPMRGTGPSPGCCA